jgi:hypothetical protein
VYVATGDRLTFRRVPPPTLAALEPLVRVISERVARALEGQGVLVRDLESSFLTVDSPDDVGFDDLLGHSITYRVALGPHQGRKAFTLQTVPAATDAIDCCIGVLPRLHLVTATRRKSHPSADEQRNASISRLHQGR